jgi:small nuclear ribonucleoprotein (snRNP)-like protein
MCNKEVLIKLKNHTTIRGKLQTFDQHMNMLLTNVEDITEEKPKNLDKIILRGDNILIVSIPKE